MNCPSCETGNPAEASFCMKCGAPLANTCAQCRTELPAEAQFCYKCGHRIGDTKVAAAHTWIRQYIPAELLTKLESACASGSGRTP